MVADEQDLKDMKLHTKTTVGSAEIQRVPGGWIYWRTHDSEANPDDGISDSCAVAGVFVPEP